MRLAEALGERVPGDRLAEIAWDEERLAQCHVLSDIFGNPFRQVSLPPYWLLWKNSPVTRTAWAIYDEGCFDALAELGDLLEEAGCDHPEILSHCQRPRGHVHGCWVVDLILGKRLGQRRPTRANPVPATATLATPVRDRQAGAPKRVAVAGTVNREGPGRG